MTTRVAILADDPGALPPGRLWSPFIGVEAQLVLSSVPESERRRVGEEAAGILGQCLPVEGGAESRTGLVVGYIQSGKTLSFTTVAALARDNGFGIVVLVAGSSQLLLDQSRDRLKRDLALDRDDAFDRWMHFRSPTLEGPDRMNMRAALEDWRDPDVQPGERPTLLITVMKNSVQLRKLADVLERLRTDGLGALLIDDEADQASLNTRWRQGEESATYFQLLRVRAALPRHTLLQYTATPQAPLLLSLVDSLSPDFTCVLTPGHDYVGGREFFAPGSPYVRAIDDLDAQAAVDAEAEPPPSLLDALRVFLIGAAAAQAQGEHPLRRSMLVHPSQKIIPQSRFENWLRRAMLLWGELLQAPDGDKDRNELLARFEDAHAELARTVPELPGFGAIAGRLPRLLRRTKIEVINAAVGPTPKIEWGTAPAWILVGGQLLDRGFTVEGLTVTYMSRPKGIGNADTVQQRARFYGYKRPYLHHCRLYLESGTRDALEAYVRHEQEMRRTLIEFARTGRPLSEWKRQFLLAPGLKPSRASVLSLPHRRVGVGDWFSQRFAYVDAGAVRDNRDLIDRVFAQYAFRDLPGRTPHQTHKVATVGIRDLLKDFLAEYVVADGRDAAGFSAILIQLGVHLDNLADDAPPASIYVMRPGVEVGRALAPTGAIEQPFEGPSTNYVGDPAFHADGISLQLHRLNLHTKEEPGRNAFTGIPVLAVWVPPQLAADWLVQTDL